MRYAVHTNVGYNNNHYYHYFIQPIFTFPSAISDLGFWKISLQWFSHVSLPVSPTPGLEEAPSSGLSPPFRLSPRRLQPPGKCSLQPPFSFLLPPLTLHLLPAEESAECSLIDSLCLFPTSWVPIMGWPRHGPWGFSSEKPNIHLMLHNCQTKRQVHHRFSGKSCLDEALCQAVCGNSGHRGQRTS